MQVIYDAHTDTLTIIFREVAIADSDEQSPGIIFDYDDQGDLVALEILDASRRITQPTQMMYQLVGYQVATKSKVPVPVGQLA